MSTVLGTELVAIYLRKSRSDEGLDALKNHKAVLTRLAEQNGFKFDIYEEIGSSVSLDARERLNELLDNISKYSRVLVMDLDRLARSIVIMEEIKEKLKYHGVKILTPSQEIDLNNESNEMLMDFQSVIAKAEYQQIRKRMQLGKVEGARAGYWVNGVAPLGYQYDRNTRKLVINEQEYPLVRELFKMGLQNMSYQEIAVNLNIRGYRTRLGNTFSVDSVKTVLVNRAYVGDVIYRKKSKVKGGQDTVIVSHNAHPAIIDETDFLEIQRLIHNRRTNVGKTKSYVKSMVQGLCYCGQCGKKLTINVMSKRSPKDRTGEYYVKGCNRSDDLGQYSCSNRSMKVDDIEKVIVQAIRAQREAIEDKVKHLLSSDNSGLEAEVQGSIKMAQVEIKKIETKLERLMDVYLDGDLDKPTYLKKKAQQEEQIQHLKDDVRRNELKLNNLDTEAQVERLKKALYALDTFERLEIQEANRFLQTLISRIEIIVKPDTKSIMRRAKKEPQVKIYWTEEMA
jgi:site-specific DNA recombinase